MAIGVTAKLSVQKGEKEELSVVQTTARGCQRKRRWM